MKTNISFGLVHMPVTLSVSTRRLEISFNNIKKNTMSRIKYTKTCVECSGEEVKDSNILKAYQYEKGRYVVFDDDDLEKLKTKKDKTIAIDIFVDLESIDPLYYDKTYYVSPRDGSEKPFALLKTALFNTNKVGIAKTMLGTKEVLVALRAGEDSVILNTMFFEAEVTAPPAIKKVEVGDKELKLATTLIDTLSGEFNPDSYKNEYQERLKEAIKQKIEGREIVASTSTSDFKVIDLMEALENSLKEIGKQVPKKVKQR